jgi:hypothetical protein
MFKTKGAMFGVAAALVVAGLTFASMAVSTTSGAGTDDTAVPTVITDTPPQSPIEAPADTTANPGGGSQGAGTGPEGLPNAGYGSESAGTNTMLLGLAGIVLMAGSGMMFVASRAGSRKQ